MSKKTTFEVEDDMEREPLDTDFEEKKPATRGACAKIDLKKRGKENSLSSRHGASFGRRKDKEERSPTTQRGHGRH